MEIIKILVKIITKSICVKLDKTCLSAPKHPHLSPTLPLIFAAASTVHLSYHHQHHSHRDLWDF